VKTNQEQEGGAGRRMNDALKRALATKPTPHKAVDQKDRRTQRESGGKSGSASGGH